MAFAPDLYSPEYLYTSDNSPVQFGSLYEIKRYLKRENPLQLSRYLRELDEYAKGILLGTHRGVAHKKEGEYNYSLFAHRDEFFECDLMDVYGKRPRHIFKLNDGYVFALIVINAKTKMVHFRLLKTKGGVEVAKATKEIFTLDVKPEIEGFKEVMLHSDYGKECACRYCTGWLTHSPIQLAFRSQSRCCRTCYKNVARTTGKGYGVEGRKVDNTNC